MRTLDLMLLYYDKPEILRNWFHRLAFHSDFQRFADHCFVYIADTGSPMERVNESLKVCNAQPQWLKNRIVYVRGETEEIRKQVPSDMDARPMCHAKNMIAFELSKADVLLTSMIGHIFSPKYFAGHVAKHLQDLKAVVLPKRFDLFSETYHIDGFKKPWEEVIKENIQPSGGWPDMSVRRKWIVEVGGWEEDYITISPDDMDMGSRLTGKLDNGSPSEALFTFKKNFHNLGLNFHQPYYPDFFSLTCNTYPGHVEKENPRRQKGYEKGIQIYLSKWGQIQRNENRKPIKYKLLDIEASYG